jgi:Arc/MetJ-type ribon-helix-helix transcriptional regulator
MLITKEEVTMRTAKVFSISLSPELQREIIEIADEERRSISEVLREAFRLYAANYDLAKARKKARKVNQRKKYKPEEIEDLVDKGRK